MHKHEPLLFTGRATAMRGLTIGSCLMVCASGGIVASTHSIASGGTVTQERQAELSYLLEQGFGSCHGLTLKGGLGSPLTLQALAGKQDEYLFAVIQNGIPDTPMPPWSALLDDADIRWLVDRLKGKEASQ